MRQQLRALLLHLLLGLATTAAWRAPTRAHVPGRRLLAALRAHVRASAEELTVDDPQAQAEVRAAFEAYEHALEVNDVPALDDAFWRSERTIRLARDGHGFGWDQIHNHRVARDFTPGSNSKGERVSLHVTTFGRSFATVFLVYRLKADPSKLGRQTQSWVAFPGADGERAWRVTSAHVSLFEGAATPD
tara:strand:+ start:20 stop:586 length:567 start_codon:yes stop_codon:yes gene_type:complete